MATNRAAFKRAFPDFGIMYSRPFRRAVNRQRLEFWRQSCHQASMSPFLPAAADAALPNVALRQRSLSGIEAGPETGTAPIP
jgi:hypothetical protein